MDLHNFHEQTECKEGKTSLIQRLRKMSTRAKIASVACAVLVLAAAGTGVFFLTRQSGTIPTAAAKAPSAVASKPAVTALSLSQSTVSLDIGKAVQITSTPKPVLPDVKVVWKSSDEKVATVSSVGLVTAISKGTCTITASVGTAVSASVQVTVKDPGDEEIELLKAYLKNGLQAPSPEFIKKSSHGMDGDGDKVTIKKLNDAAIVDLNGDGHYEMIVEDLFHMIPVRGDQYEYEPFYEIYYVKGGKVVRSPKVIGTENGDYMGSTECFLAQDSRTKKYYLVIDETHGMGDSYVKYQASIINGKTITPVMNIESGYYTALDPKGNDGDLFALNGKEVDEAGFEEASKRLLPIHFDLPRDHYGKGYQDNKAGTVQSKTFDMDQIEIYKNSTIPISSIDDIIKSAQARITADPANLMDMSIDRIKKLCGRSHQTTLPSDAVWPCANRTVTKFYNYPYMLTNNNSILIMKSGTAFYKNVKTGMTLSQIESIVKDIQFGDPEGGDVGEVYFETLEQSPNLTYVLSFDHKNGGLLPSSKCVAVEIEKSIS
jgi:hypothetical protein